MSRAGKVFGTVECRIFRVRATIRARIWVEMVCESDGRICRYIHMYVCIDTVSLLRALHSSKSELISGSARNSRQNFHPHSIPFFPSSHPSTHPSKINHRFKTGIFRCLYPYHFGNVLPYPLPLLFPFDSIIKSSIALPQ